MYLGFLLHKPNKLVSRGNIHKVPRVQVKFRDNIGTE